jgi:hypothetical protein
MNDEAVSKIRSCRANHRQISSPKLFLVQSVDSRKRSLVPPDLRGQVFPPHNLPSDFPALEGLHVETSLRVLDCICIESVTNSRP